ncbi:MAG: hypothetical protein ACJA09_002476 [Alcanivorax sp.]|jgi:hypothetical protein
MGHSSDEQAENLKMDFTLILLANEQFATHKVSGKSILVTRGQSMINSPHADKN